MSTYPGKDHHLTVTIDNGGEEGDIDLRITCSAPEGAFCRLTCGDGCEEFSFEGHEHPLVDSGFCNALEYIEAQGVAESYEGDWQPLRSGPVTLTYHDGDYYVSWSFAATHETVQSYRSREVDGFVVPWNDDSADELEANQ